MTSYDVCKKNWQRILVGDPEQLKNGDENVKARITACENKAVKAWNTYKENGKKPDAVGLFRSTPAERSWDMTVEYRSLSEMAVGYATYGTSCYRSPELLRDILAALEWGYTHYYGKAEIANQGWRDTKQFNWWDWCIGTPTGLMNTIVLVDEHLTLQQKRDYIELFDVKVPKPRDYGANKVNFGRLIAQAGVLCERPEQIYNGRDGIEDTYLYADGGVNDGQGFYRDGSYIFHTLHPMNFTYGIEHFAKLIDFAAILAGSEFELKKEHTDLLYTWLYKTYLPFCRNGEVFRSVLGRDPAGTVGAARGFIAHVVRLYGLSAPEKKPELSKMITMLTDEDPLSKDGERGILYSAFSLSDYLTFLEAYKPETATDEVKKARAGFKAFNCMDRAVQHADGYSFSLSISSSRIYNYECINHQNMNGWYHGDGMLNLISSPFKYDAEFWKQADPYRMPGTTADDRPRETVTIAQANEYLSSKDFVGALSTGETGIAVMELESYHSDGALICNRFYNPSGAYGGPPPVRECTLTANKAYFFMDGYAVCLGSGVNARDNARVYTTVENQHGETVVENGRVTGYKPLAVTLNGNATDLPTVDTVYEGVKYITVGSDAFCILDGSPITARKTEGDVPFAQIVVDHGVNPENGTYAYAILPNTDAEGARAFSENLPFEIVANDETVQAIREKATGDIYCVFHGAGEIKTGDTVLSVETALLCAIKDNTVHACDVTQKLAKATVTVNGKEYSFDFGDTLGVVKPPQYLVQPQGKSLN